MRSTLSEIRYTSTVAKPSPRRGNRPAWSPLPTPSLPTDIRLSTSTKSWTPWVRRTPETAHQHKVMLRCPYLSHGIVDPHVYRVRSTPRSNRTYGDVPKQKLPNSKHGKNQPLEEWRPFQPERGGSEDADVGHVAPATTRHMRGHRGL